MYDSLFKAYLVRCFLVRLVPLVLTNINGIHSNLKLKITHEQQGSINFLDLTITRNQNKLEIDIYRKPTATDTIINFLSNHPIEHKMAAYRYYTDRMHALPLDESKKTERMANHPNNRKKQQCTDTTT